MGSGQRLSDAGLNLQQPSGLLGITADLIAEFLKTAEPLLSTQALDRFHPQLPSFQIKASIEQMDFHR